MVLELPLRKCVITALYLPSSGTSQSKQEKLRDNVAQCLTVTYHTGSMCVGIRSLDSFFFF